MLDATAIGFQRLGAADLELMHRWLNTDFVVQWYGKRRCSYQEVVEHYSPRIDAGEPTKSFLILYGDNPVGYIQTYRIGDHPEYSKYVQVGKDAAGVDLFIGEADYIHKGLGSSILRKFMRDVVFANPSTGCCVIGPEPENKAAIKAYEKAGFRHFKTAQIPGEARPEYLMRISRNEALSG